jgi:hypothetical protein
MNDFMRSTFGKSFSRFAATASLALLSSAVLASSHSDAPLIKQDPQANLTDVYAFIGTKVNDSTKQVLNIVVNVHPFCEPGDGVMYDRFADDALYSINITNPTTGAITCTYNFRFSPVSSAAGNYKNLNTILSYGRGTAVGAIQDVGDAHQNYLQTYSVTKVTSSGSTVVGSNLKCPPPNVGLRTTPAYNDSNGIAVSGASSFNGLDTYTKETVYSLNSGESVFCGSRDDSFFADAPGIFDLLNPRILGPDGQGQTGNGVDGFKGYNVLTYAIQVPLSSLKTSSYSDAFTGASTGVGVYASVSRQRITLRNTSGDPLGSGPWIQVNRLGNPLFNEVLVALKDKDNYNRTSPPGDAAYATYALNPEVAVLINAVYGTSIATTGRTDLEAVFIPDVLRVDTTTGPVPLIGAGGNRLSGLGGDTTSGKWSGWPNGRRLGDDVVDIALTAVASGPTYSSIFLLGDNINANDEAYNLVFPYAATPHAGTTNRKDPGD